MPVDFQKKNTYDEILNSSCDRRTSAFGRELWLNSIMLINKPTLITVCNFLRYLVINAVMRLLVLVDDDRNQRI